MGIGPHLCNLRKDNVDKRDFQFKGSPLAVHLEIPQAVDHRKFASSVRDQGNLGSCVGFAAAAVKEFSENREHSREVAAGKDDHREGRPYDLSEQWIYYNCKKIDPWPGTEGTSIRFAMKVLQKIGVPPENAWPYSDIKVGEPESWAYLIARWGLIGRYFRIESLAELLQALVNAPVVIGVGVYEEFFTPQRDGTVPYPKNPNYCYGGHAIAAFGYDRTRDRVLFKNSWGTSWGSGGYGQLPFRYIQDFMWDAWMYRDIEVVPSDLIGQRDLA